MRLIVATGDAIETEETAMTSTRSCVVTVLVAALCGCTFLSSIRPPINANASNANETGDDGPNGNQDFNDNVAVPGNANTGEPANSNNNIDPPENDNASGPANGNDNESDVVNGNSNNNDNASDDDNFLDLSGFTEFEFSRTWRYCLDGAPITSLRINRFGAGDSFDYELSMTAVIPGDPEMDDCNPDYQIGGCLVDFTYEPRRLYESERVEMLDVFSSIGPTAPLPGCGAIDLCGMANYRWDDTYVVTDNPCHSSLVIDTDLREFLDGLKERNDALLPETRDLSGFETFAFETMPALYFCLDVGSVYSATLTAVGETYEFAADVVDSAVPFEPFVDTCDGTIIVDHCVTFRTIGPRQLGDEEAEAVRGAFSAIVLGGIPGPLCEGVVADPCDEHVYTWDGVAFSDVPCTTSQYLGGVGTLFDDLASVDTP